MSFNTQQPLNLLAPMRVETGLIPQFQIADGQGSRLTVGVARGRTHFWCADPIEFSRLRAASVRADAVRIAGQVISMIVPITVPTFAIDTSAFGNILSFTSVRTDPIDIVLPPAALILTRVPDVVAGDTITFDIINQMPTYGRLVVGAPLDTIAPVNMGADVVIGAGSSARMLCYIASTEVGAARVQYYLLGGSVSSLAPLTRVARTAELTGTNPYAIYCVDETDAIYRYGSKEVPECNWVVGPVAGPGVDFTSLAEAIADRRVDNGQSIMILNGTYSIDTTVVIDKSLLIYGESRAGVILRGPVGGTAGGVMLAVGVDQVAIMRMTLIDTTANGASASTIITISNALECLVSDCAFSMTNDAIRMTQVEIWRINACSFAYVGVQGGTGLARAIYIASMTGTGFIDNCTATNVTPAPPQENIPAGALHFVFAALASCVGSSTFSMNACSCASAIEYVLDIAEFAGAPQILEMYIIDNNFAETGAFINIHGGTTANFGDVIGHIIATGNHYSNTGGRGFVAVSSTAQAPIAFRSVGDLYISRFGNVAGGTDVAPGWTLVDFTTLARVCFEDATISPVGVTQDGSIPSQPMMVPLIPGLGAIYTGMFRLGNPQMAKESRTITSADFSYFDLVQYARALSTIITRNREFLVESVDYVASYVGGVTRITWIGELLQEGTHPLMDGDRISVAYQQYH